MAPPARRIIKGYGYRKDEAEYIEAVLRRATYLPPRFPADVVLLFFEHMPITGLVTASHVCREWRGLVYEQSEFTRDIKLELECTTDIALARFAAQLGGRGSTRLIKLHIYVRILDTYVESRILRSIAPHLGRTTHLTLMLESSFAPAVWRCLQRPIPHLKSLNISFHNLFTRAFVQMPPDLFGGHAPLLRNFSCAGLRLPGTRPSAFDKVQELCIVGGVIEVNLKSLAVCFPKLLRLALRAEGEHCVHIIDDFEPVKANRPRFGKLRLDLSEDVHHILLRTWFLSMFRHIVVVNPTEIAFSMCFQGLPSEGPLHLRITPDDDNTEFLVDFRLCDDSQDRLIRFQLRRNLADEEPTRFRNLFPEGEWTIRVTDVTIAQSLWAHPRLAEWVPRLPSVTRLGLILDGEEMSCARLLPESRLDLPSLHRVDVATVHGTQTVDACGLGDLVAVGLVKTPPPLIFGACVGVVVDHAAAGAVFESVQPLMRPLDLLGKW